MDVASLLGLKAIRAPNSLQYNPVRSSLLIFFIFLENQL